MNSSAHRKELGQFLKARRAELSPRTVGLPETDRRRRVAGLRRDEVAVLAAISTDYYTRLEQGRMTPSASVLSELVRVLHLSDDQRDHLFELAGREAGGTRRRAPQKAHPRLHTVLNELSVAPGMILGRYLGILAWNPMATALFGTDFAKVPKRQRNYVRLLFTAPAVRSLYADWEDSARNAVAVLRQQAAAWPGDRRLTALVGELSVQDEQFRRWWGGRHVVPRPGGMKVFNHPVACELTLAWDALTCVADPDQQLIVWSAEPDSRTYEGLRFLSSWAAAQQDDPVSGTVN
ncbi:helix-turn-helix domain-containing protein [Streptomyces paradoxus]|uniref:Transcriptional regulator with XRE-family HTH domain n=1 Tax=Streptomyces paradoxus TaxID=66375 RepID=A0A7W9T4T4_9ACTN|nr:helix-turn-helix transcriptional regulator [Streptomyces paradoxus]MBB6074130.1 transcriptional regulator with XRE-family HTH domain [Streptomyces paradoxus]